MPDKGMHKFFLSIVVPSVLAVILFVLSLYLIILPSFEKAIMDDKKEMISELTNTAWSLLVEYENEYQKSDLSREDAQRIAAERIADIRYGNTLKDYFWITDTTPQMIMHPYRPELIDSDLGNYKDPNGKKLFVEAAKVIKEQGAGFIDYMWQWKDDSTQIVPKLSYVKSFNPWGWIIGTGIYLDDIQIEIQKLKGRLLRISLLITAIIVLILLFVIRQSLLLEKKRKQLTSELMLSRQKYKSLVEASTEGTLMLLNKEIIFCNLKFSNLTGYDSSTIHQKRFEDLYTVSWQDIDAFSDDPKKTISHETELICIDGSKKNVVISISHVNYSEQNGYIVITKEVSKQKQIEQDTVKLAGELQTSLLLMNQPIRHLVNDLLTCSMDLSIQQVAELMTRKRREIVFIEQNHEIIGVVTDRDFKNRVIAEGRNTASVIAGIMTSPVVSIMENALLYEALIEFNKNQVSHLATTNNTGEFTGVVSYRDITGMQQNSVSYFIHEIEASEHIDELVAIHKKVPVLVNALVESGDKTANITKIITSISDAFAKRIIELGIEKLGEAPCKFAFMVMGSEGRMEQTLSTDQDNAIIFEDLPKDKIEIAQNYFLKLGEFCCQSLNKVGYRLCKGDVMAGNKKWNQSLSIWKEYFSGWISNSDPHNIMEASIFFDFRGLYGDFSIIAALKEFIYEAVQDKPVFLYNLSQSVGKFKPPVSIFGNIVGENTGSNERIIDIKKILMPVISFSRLYTLQKGYDETNTLFRIQKLYQEGIIPKEMYDEMNLSYDYLMQLRFRFQAKAILKGEEPTNNIDISKLTHIEVGTLKKIFAELSNIQTKVNFDFKSV